MLSTSYDDQSTLHRLASNHARCMAHDDRTGLSGKHLAEILRLIKEGAFVFKLSPRSSGNMQNSNSNEDCPVTIVKFNKPPVNPDIASAVLHFFLVEEM